MNDGNTGDEAEGEPSEHQENRIGDQQMAGNRHEREYSDQEQDDGLELMWAVDQTTDPLTLWPRGFNATRRALSSVAHHAGVLNGAGIV
jgi:hypothetical protein